MCPLVGLERGLPFELFAADIALEVSLVRVSKHVSAEVSPGISFAADFAPGKEYIWGYKQQEVIDK